MPARHTFPIALKKLSHLTGKKQFTLPRTTWIFSTLLLFSIGLQAGSYYERVIFDNSLTPDVYFYSFGQASAPSKLEVVKQKLPVDTSSFRSAPNSLRLSWTSEDAGSWEAEVNVYEFRNRQLYFPGETLSLWCFAKDGLQAANLPKLVLRDRGYGFSEPLELAPYAKDLAPGQWAKISVPLSAFIGGSVRLFQPHRLNTVVFMQGARDGAPHTLLIDEIGIERAVTGETKPLPKIQNVKAQGYERHADISWDPLDQPSLARYVIYRSTGGGPYQPVGIQVPGIQRFADWLGKPGIAASYKVAAEDAAFQQGGLSLPAGAATHTMTDDELLTMVQEASFRYYWEAGAHPASGMIRESLPGDNQVVATGATGFGIMALVTGVERGFITREQGLARLLQITEFLTHADRFHGVWPHFTYGDSGKRMPLFGMYDNGADLVETSFLMEGLLTAREYFKGASAAEKTLYQRITTLWEGIEWDWFRRTPDGDALFWHWSPEFTWHIKHRLTGWNEVMITYLLAIASPTHGVPASLYSTGWAGQSEAAINYRQAWGQAAAGDHYLNGQVYDGIKLDVGVGSGGPLFFTHYSFLGFDPHVRDAFTNYFENNRNLALINRAYCIRNPGHFKDYGPQFWGLSASDGPSEYHASAPDIKEDDGTMAPTGAISSMPYTPEPSMEALKYFYRNMGGRLWGEYGFRDAINPTDDWVSGIYMGLNQAPMVVMIENYRTGLLWKNFSANAEIQQMRRAIGFKK